MAAQTSKGPEKVHQVQLFGFRGERRIINLCDTKEQFQRMTVLQLKEKIEETGLCDRTDKENLRLFCGDHLLYNDSARLCEYGVKHLSTIHMAVKVPGGGGDPGIGDGGMGDKGGKNRSMERLSSF